MDVSGEMEVYVGRKSPGEASCLSCEFAGKMADKLQ